MLNSVVLISVGAAVGAVARWLLGLALNAAFPAIPPGTLLANLLGGYLVGVAIEALSAPAGLNPELRLLVITGFLGGLTTFSTFSAEVAKLLQQGSLLLAGTEIAAHVLGSVLLTILGIATVMAVRRAAYALGGGVGRAGGVELRIQRDVDLQGARYGAVELGVRSDLGKALRGNFRHHGSQFEMRGVNSPKACDLLKIDRGLR